VDIDCLMYNIQAIVAKTGKSNKHGGGSSRQKIKCDYHKEEEGHYQIQNQFTKSEAQNNATISIRFIPKTKTKDLGARSVCTVGANNIPERFWRPRKDSKGKPKRGGVWGKRQAWKERERGLSTSGKNGV